MAAQSSSMIVKGDPIGRCDKNLRARRALGVTTRSSFSNTTPVTEAGSVDIVVWRRFGGGSAGDT